MFPAACLQRDVSSVADFSRDPAVRAATVGFLIRVIAASASSSLMLGRPVLGGAGPVLAGPVLGGAGSVLSGPVLGGAVPVRGRLSPDAGPVLVVLAGAGPALSAVWVCHSEPLSGPGGRKAGRREP